MRLKHIKLSGFKSFVDPTTISMPAQLVGVVGPNGCGKSNVIDAVRWVMGESSAKNLRGDSMADVIFNGSSSRKPVGKAAVELVFDNHDGKAPGAYAKFTEIAIRREVTRDGGSKYSINKTRCRRRDIRDLFHGTGLGPRSYSIIEQGMVSRIVEAKPEELRALIEEASGVSRYKERRQETENRIRHTRDNLDRVEDIRSELATQLRRLKRQSSAAERYKKLKKEERLLAAQLLSLKWTVLDTEVKKNDGSLERQQTELESIISEQRSVEKEIEGLRQNHVLATESFNQTQGEFYQIGAEISGVEQNIEHAKDTQAQQLKEFDRLTDSQQETHRHLEGDQQRQQEIEGSIKQTQPLVSDALEAFEETTGVLAAAEQAYNLWQTEWDGFSEQAASPEKDRVVQKTRIEADERQIVQTVSRISTLRQQLADIETSLDNPETNRLQSALFQSEQLSTTIGQDIELLDQRQSDYQSQQNELQEKIDDVRDEYRNKQARLLSLEELRDTSNSDGEGYSDWLRQQNLDTAPRLATLIQVEAGWEHAVDCVLGQHLTAMCVESISDIDGLSDDISHPVQLLEKSRNGTISSNGFTSLFDKVVCKEIDLSAWLEPIRLAESIDDAMALRSSLKNGQAIITRDGAWVGKNWLSTSSDVRRQAGLLSREADIEELAKDVEHYSQTNKDLDHQILMIHEQLDAISEERSEKVRSVSEQQQHQYKLNNKLAAMDARNSEQRSRLQQMRSELSELESQLSNINLGVSDAKNLLGVAEKSAMHFEVQRNDLQNRRSEIREQLDHARMAADSTRDAKHRQEFELQRLEAENQSLQQSIQRLQLQQKTATMRLQELEGLLRQGDQPEQSFQGQLEGLLEQRVLVEKRLGESRENLTLTDEKQRKQETQRSEYEQSVQAVRELMEQARIGRQEVVVRRDTLQDQVAEYGFSLTSVLEELVENATIDQWQEQLERLNKRIERIGPVNLVAIEEYEEQTERKVYLDRQNEDLTEALATLEAVIEKIDRETRTRFKDTFDKLNARFQEFFPKLFGGGVAYIDMTSTDLLNTGVTVMARPPGKRNSTIHLLSGGEKALTAVSLMFAFFDLNPAPFCLLDEVDAPLDDANVERYSRVLEQLSQTTQLIFITHNKITMESANVLIGITMAEPGVSRLVAVDIDQAVEMVAQ